MTESFNHWINQNAFKGYTAKMADVGVEDLTDLSKEVLENDEQITAFIKDDLEVVKKLQAKKLFKAIKKLQAEQEPVADLRVELPALDVQTLGYDVNAIVGITKESQIGVVVSKHGVSKIADLERGYYEVDVKDAMHKLATCGELIQLAFASSDGFACQKDVVLLLSKYGTMVKDSHSASSNFVRASMEALGLHQLALRVFSENPQKSLVLIAKCSKLAAMMTQIATKCSIAATQLRKHAQDALYVAVDNKITTNEARDKVVDEMRNAKNLQAKIKRAQEDLGNDLLQIKQEEAKEFAAVEKEKKRDFIISIIGAVLGRQDDNNSNSNSNGNNNSNSNSNSNSTSTSTSNSSSNPDSDDAKKESSAKPDTSARASDRLMLLTEKKYKIKSLLIEQNAIMAETLSKLENFQLKTKDLAGALYSIEIVINTLGKIKVIFDNTRRFWEDVERNCQQLAEVKDTAGDIFGKGGCGRIELMTMREQIAKSALGWFVLCKVNFDAKKEIQSVDRAMDSIMSNLPGEAEAQAMVPRLTQKLKADLKEETKMLVQDQTAIAKTQK